MPSTFSFEDAASLLTLAPFVAREQAFDAARTADAEREAARSRGVRASGLEPQPFQPRTKEAIRYDARVAADRAAAFAGSARGRFLLAIRSLQDLGYGAEAETARNAMARGFARPDEPASPKEVGFAIKTLSPVNHPDARIALEALGELLCAEQKAAA